MVCPGRLRGSPVPECLRLPQPCVPNQPEAGGQGARAGGTYGSCSTRSWSLAWEGAQRSLTLPG